jgi:hypothetical protein
MRSSNGSANRGDRVATHLIALAINHGANIAIEKQDRIDKESNTTQFRREVTRHNRAQMGAMARGDGTGVTAPVNGPIGARNASAPHHDVKSARA